MYNHLLFCTMFKYIEDGNVKQIQLDPLFCFLSNVLMLV